MWASRLNRQRSWPRPVKKVVKMLLRHEEYLLNDKQHVISNTCAEGTRSARRMRSVGSIHY